MRRIGVLMGGWGEEREVSLHTGEAVAQALKAKGHDFVVIDVGSDLPRRLSAARVDTAFLALHGRIWEDGSIQGLLEVLGIPYTGSGVLASAAAMDKPFAKKLLRLHNVPVPLGYDVAAGEGHGDLGFPAIVKPSRGGSSVGVTVVETAEMLAAAVRAAEAFGGGVMVEERLVGREVTVAVLDGRALGTCEIAFGAGVFGYAQKYGGQSTYHVPARLSDARRKNVEVLAVRATHALGVRGYARVDFICGETKNDVVLEVNTLPGFTATSLFPQIARAAGLSFADLVDQILGLAALDNPRPKPAGVLRAAM